MPETGDFLRQLSRRTVDSKQFANKTLAQGNSAVSHTMFDPKWLCFLPALIMLFGAVFGRSMSKAGNCVVARPCPQVFMLVWTLVTVDLGVIWYLFASGPSKWNTWLFTLLSVFIGLCLLWIVVFRSSRVMASRVLLVLLAVGFMTFGILQARDPFLAFLFAPILGWLVYANTLGLMDLQCNPPSPLPACPMPCSSAPPLCTKKLR